MTILRILFVAVVGAAGAALAEANAQAVGSRPSPAFSVEEQVRERWQHGRQQSRFSPFDFGRSWIFVDSLRNDARERTMFLTLSRSFDGRDSATIVVDPTGRIAAVHLGLSSSKRRPSFGDDSANFSLEQRRAALRAETRLWEFAPTFPRGTPTVGLAWTDTIAHLAADTPFRQSLRGTRVSRIARDTVVDGRRLWIVRDSAAIEYEERYLETERTLDASVEVSRIARGTLRGVHVYDPELGLFRWREDTTRLVGEAVLRYPDGRTFRTPARYERMRRSDLYDSAAYSARIAALRAENRRDFGGMVIVPANDLQRRLSDGDSVARDSILRAWRQSSDPDEAEWLFNLLERWGATTEDSRARLDSVRIATGDTAFLYHFLADRAYRREPADTADVRAMIAFMRDPSIAWGFNLSRDWLYENLVQAMTTWPRAAAVGYADATVSCTLGACRMLGAQRSAAREPRLRDVALVALLSLDPRRWADTVLALSGPRHPLLRSAAMLARGVGATWTAASKAPLPAPDSEWQAWLEWMNGVDPRYAADMATSAVRPPLSVIDRVRFEESHRTAIRFYTARTGRDVVGELQRAYDAAQSDSARFIYATMLQQLGAFRLSESEIAEALTSGVAARIAMGQKMLVAHFSRADTLAAPAATTALVDRIVSAAVDGTPLWRAGIPDPRRTIGDLPGLHASVGRLLLATDSLPDAVRAKWGSRIEIIERAAWGKRDPRVGGVLLSVAPILSWGRFATVSVTISERLSRRPGEAPEHYASGATYYLMELNGEWVVVAQDGWIT